MRGKALWGHKGDQMVKKETLAPLPRDEVQGTQNWSSKKFNIGGGKKGPGKHKRAFPYWVRRERERNGRIQLKAIRANQEGETLWGKKVEKKRSIREGPSS